MSLGMSLCGVQNWPGLQLRELGLSYRGATAVTEVCGFVSVGTSGCTSCRMPRLA